jgi:hypothetical protein
VSGFARLIPVLIVIVAFFSLFQLWTAIVYLAQQEYIGGALYLVFSFAGLALARALWMNRAKFSRD